MPPEPPEFTVETTHSGDVATVTLTGEIDLLMSTRLNREFEMLFERVPPPLRVRVNLREVSFMDTSGVAILLKARRRALELDCGFTVSSTSPVIARLFEITGLAGLLTETGGE